MNTISGEIPSGETQATIVLPEGTSDFRVTLVSSYTNWRMMEICKDGSDFNYDVPVYTGSDENHIFVDVAGSATHVRVTGVAGDKYEILPLNSGA